MNPELIPEKTNEQPPTEPLETNSKPTSEEKDSEKPKQTTFFSLLKETLSRERTTEFLSAHIMAGLELLHDARLYPARYKLRPDQVGSLPNPETDPVAAWTVDHIGDIWEISAGHTAMRLGFVAVNRFLRSDFIKEKVTNGKEVQIPDEVCFWTSLMTTVTVKAAHSLGYISLLGIHDHMDHPVPEMLFGQGVAAIVIAATHYAAKYGEPVKDLASRAIRKIFEYDDEPNTTPNLGEVS